MEAASRLEAVIMEAASLAINMRFQVTSVSVSSFLPSYFAQNYTQIS
jgi:hypothetical protein